MTATEAKQFAHLSQRRLGLFEFYGSTDETWSVHLTLTPGDPARIDQELPSRTTGDDRYDPIGMNRLNR
jgi:hypothetical protein